MLKQSGIYVIRHNESGRTYVGSSKNVKRRISCHKNELKKNLHTNKSLQNYFNKYGIDSLSFEFIYYVFDISCLISIENYFISAYNESDIYGNLDRKKLFNTQWAGKTGCVSIRKYGKDHWSFGKIGPNKGRIFTDEVKRNMSIGQIGKKSGRKYKHKMVWSEMTYNRQYKLWKNNDPMVPTGWVPSRLKGKLNGS